MTAYRHTFWAIGCEHRVLVTDPAMLAAAGRIAEEAVAELDRAASRFRTDSELTRITRRAGDTDVHVVVSPTLGHCLAAALRAADITDGLVDPTVGAAVVAAGYDADLATVLSRGGSAGGTTHTLLRPAVPGWRTVAYDERTRLLSVRRGTVLDLGASAKAHTADVVADRLARQLGGGFLVDLGGDIAVSGLLPVGGWEIGVEDEHGRTTQVVVSSGQALATSSTRLRTWTVGGERRHHIVDPRTGRVARSVWAQVSCAGVSALEANAASTAAAVLGDEAPEWLVGHGIPARLDGVADLVVTTPGWPQPHRRAA